MGQIRPNSFFFADSDSIQILVVQSSGDFFYYEVEENKLVKAEELLIVNFFIK